MKTVRITAATGTLLALGGLAAALSLSGPAGAATHSASTGSAAVQAARADRAAQATSSRRPVVINCLNQPVVRPVTLSLACADDGTGLQGMHWTTWAPQLASGYGTEWERDCTPNCAEGHIHYYPTLPVLWGSAVKGHPGEERYTEVTLVYPGARPPVYEIVNGKVVATYPVTQTLALAP